MHGTVSNLLFFKVNLGSKLSEKYTHKYTYNKHNDIFICKHSMANFLIISDLIN